MHVDEIEEEVITSIPPVPTDVPTDASYTTPIEPDEVKYHKISLIHNITKSSALRF